jgi:Zn finger protein HypA/HybF involved in hydrogenase expression
MHEAGIAERILDIVLEHVQPPDSARVTDVYLEVGEASDIDTGAVALHWPLLSAGTAAEGATLHFASSPEPFTFRLTSIEVQDGKE